MKLSSTLCLAIAWTLGTGGASHAQAPSYRFDLAAEKLDVPAGPWQVTRVLDLRADRSRLGSVRRGVENLSASADFIQALAPELLGFFQAKLLPRPAARPVLMRVFSLAITEDLRLSSEHSEAELEADFLELQPDSTFRVVLSVGETTRRNGLDVTRFHPANVALVLQQALRQLAAAPAAAPNPAMLSRADALAGKGGATVRRFAIQAAAAPKRGFYRSLDEFRNNAPSEADYPFAFEHVPHTGKRWAGIEDVQAYYLRTDAKHSRLLVGRAGLWGLSDGQEMLIVYRGHFYKLLPAADGQHYTFTGPALFDEQAAAAVTSAAVMGGLVGGAVAGAIVSGGAPTVPYELRLSTGRVLPVPEARQTDADGFATAPDTARVYVYRRFDSAKEQVVTLTATGQPSLRLPTRGWVALTWLDRRRDFNVCVQAAGGPETCRAFVPDFSQPNYLEYVVRPDGGAAELRPVSAKQGAFELRRIRMLKKANQ